MSALPSNVVDFRLPKKPKVKEKEPAPDQRKVAILPIRALTDPQVTDGMVRTLALVCSYCNRAGITWVSQARLAKDAGTSRQAVTKQLGKLKALGYIEVVSKHYRGIRPDTVRVIFDKSIDTETAIAVTSTIEDTRPPAMKEKQLKEAQQPKDEFTEEQLAANRKRVRQMLGGLSAGNQSIHEPRKIGDILMPKKTSPSATNKVAKAAQKTGSPSATHWQPMCNPEVAQNTERTYLTGNLKVIVERELKINFKDEKLLELLGNLSLSDEELTTACQTLSGRYQSEGLAIPTNEDQLVHDLLVIAVDAS